MRLRNITNGVIIEHCSNSGENNFPYLLLPVRKNDKVVITYNYNSGTSYLRFYYTVGTSPSA